MNLKDSFKNRAFLNMFLFFLIFFTLIFMLIGLRSFNLIRFPKFIEDVFYANLNAPEELEINDDFIYNALKNTSSDDISSENVVYPKFTTVKELQNYLSVIKPPDILYAEAEINYYDGSGKKTVHSFLWKKNDNYRLELLNENASLTERYIIKDNKEYYYNSIADEEIVFDINDSFNVSMLPNAPLLNDYIQNLSGEGRIKNGPDDEDRFKVIRRENENEISFTHVVDRLNIEEEIVYSIDFGIVNSIKTYHDGRLIYEYTFLKKQYKDDTNKESAFDIEDDKFNTMS